MSAYLARLKQLENEKNLLHSPDTVPPEPAKVPFDPFGGTPPKHNDKNFSKDEQLRELAMTARRKKVLAMLEENPGVPRAVHTETQSDPNNVILTIAIRDLATFEMLLPKARYEPWQFMAMLDKAWELH